MKSIPELSIDTRTVVDMLRAVPVGDMLTYTALDDATGRQTAGKHRYILESARRIALRDGMVFAPVHGKGVKRLADTEIVAVGAQAVSRARRIAKRGVAKLAAVRDFAKMPPAARIEHNAMMSVLGVIAYVGSTPQVKAAAEAVKTLGNSSVPPAKLLEHFTAKK